MRRERFPFARPVAVRVRARFGRKVSPARSGTRTQVGATTRRPPCFGPVLHDFAGHGARRLESGRDQFPAGDDGRFDGMDSGPWASPVLRVVWDFRHRDFDIHLSEVPGLCVPLHSPRLDHMGCVERWRGASMPAGQLDLIAWSLWAANLLFAINQIQYVQLRIHAAHTTNRSEKLSAGRWFLNRANHPDGICWPSPLPDTPQCRQSARKVR